MPRILLHIFFVFSFTSGFGEIIDSLTNRLTQSIPERDRIEILNRLSFEYTQFSIDKARALALDAIIRAEQVNYEKGIADGYNNIGICYAKSGEIEKGLENFLIALRIREKQTDLEGGAKILNNIAGTFLYQQEYDKALDYSRKSLQMLSTSGNDLAIGNAYLSKGLIWEEKGDYDSALLNFEQAIKLFEKINRGDKILETKISQAEILEKKGEYLIALEACLLIKEKLKRDDASDAAVDLYHLMGRLNKALGQKERALQYLHRSKFLAKKSGSKSPEIKVVKTLSESFRAWKMYDSALFYYEQYSDLKVQSLSLQRSKQSAILEKLYENEKRDRELETSLAKVQSQSLIIGIASVLLTFSFLLGIVFYRNYQKKQKINHELLELNSKVTAQNAEITAQANELNQVNQKMELINQSLEQQVALRTRHIIDQNKRLIDYAHLNAHHLRAPLSNILGLLNLIHFEKLSVDDQIVFRKIQESADDLDNVVAEINERIYEDDFELREFMGKDKKTLSHKTNLH